MAEGEDVSPLFLFVMKEQTIARIRAKSEEEKTLDVFDESESVRMTEMGEFFGKRERQKKRVKP